MTNIYTPENTSENLNIYVIQFETEDMTDDAVMPKYKSTLSDNSGNSYIIWLSSLDDYTCPAGNSYFKQIKTTETTDKSLEILSVDNETCNIPEILHNFIIKALNLLDEYKTIGYNKLNHDLFTIITPPIGNIKETRIVKTVSSNSATDEGYYTKYWGQAVGVYKNTKDRIKIGNGVFLIMDYNSNTIDFGYTWTKHKQQKQSRMTTDIENIIYTKLDDTDNNSVQNLFNNNANLPDSSKYYISNTSSKSKSSKGKSKSTKINNDGANNGAYIEIFNTETEIKINDLNFNTTQYNLLKNKPHTLLKHKIGSTFINILISILDKPHDIIGSRVSSTAQNEIMNKVIIPNLNNYIEYMTVIKEYYLSDIPSKKDKITTFINFVKIMLESFNNTSPSKTFSSELSYENAILYLVCKYHNDNFFPKTEFNLTFKSIGGIIDADDKNSIIINPDIMNLTKEIKTVLNTDTTNAGARIYFSTPEVIDHGHVYPNINNETRIEFPENYKEIQLPIINIDKDKVHPQSVDSCFVIHSYSTTNKRNEKDEYESDEYKLNYIVYVWFTILTITSSDESSPLCVIKYTVPFRNAPDCAKVYEGYHNIIGNLTSIKTKITESINKIEKLTKYGEKMKNVLISIVLDQFFNSKSLQDDQNQLQVNQLSTIPPPELSTISPDITKPTTFIGLCTDLASAANGINYYFSRTESDRNQSSIVAYYSKLKKNAKCIWAQSNTIHFLSEKKINIQIANNILDIILKKDKKDIPVASKKKKTESKNKKASKKKKGGVLTLQDNKVQLSNRTLKKKSSTGNTRKVKKNLHTKRERNKLFDVHRNDDSINDNYQITTYNTMFDIFYIYGNRSYNKKTDFDYLFKRYKDTRHFNFTIYSNHFITIFLDNLEIIKLINETTIYDIADKLLKDQLEPFYPNNLYGTDRSIDGQINLSNDLYKRYESIVKNTNKSNTTQTMNVEQPINNNTQTMRVEEPINNNTQTMNVEEPINSKHNYDSNKRSRENSMLISNNSYDSRKSSATGAGYKK